ncbi:MAG: alcohol dehydrogenase catalytic domain-containing protein [Nitrososphaeria archaeon]|nr:alcohol dehydrogenase catalytic domain-containing protein [Nitrososphaeria archaeon]
MSRSMLAAYVNHSRELYLKYRDMIKPSRREIIVKIMACGICPTDVRYLLGYGGPIPYGEESYGLTGHEWSGVVVELGEDVEDLMIDDRVVIDHIAYCGKCRYCRRGQTNHCIEKRYYLRGFAEYGLAYAPTILKLSEKLSFEEACFVEPLSSCINSIEKASPSFSDILVVIGDGVIGILHSQLAKLRGAEVVMIGHHNERLSVAEKLGVDYTLNSREVDVFEEVKKITDGRGADSVIVAVQGAEAIDSALKLVCKNGKIIIFAGTYPETALSINPNLIHYSEFSIIGASEHTPRQFTQSLNLIEKKIIKVKPLISNVVPLEKINQGFNLTINRKGLKTIVKPHEE